VPVEVQGDGDGGVTKLLLDILWMRLPSSERRMLA